MGAGGQMIGRRLWAAAALLLALVAIGLAVAVAVAHFPKGLSVLVCLVLAACAAWYGARRRGTARTIGIGAAALLLCGAIVLVIVEGRVLEDLLVIAGVVGALAAARLAFRGHVHWPQASRPAHPALFYNPKSGGGKAERFHLANEARRRGIDAVELKRGDDLEELVRGAVARGADALAMAGGDGSQAIVAMIAAELDLPYACIPAGTRNHFALDLGVDRDDVVGALDAFVNGGERRVDLAEVNGRVFVNSDGPAAAGIDGEAMHLDPPLRFRIRPRALRVRLAPHHPGASPSALQPDKPWQMIETLATFALHGGPRNGTPSETEAIAAKR